MIRVEAAPSNRSPPRCCVWEITLACDAKCVHCGSSAGRARKRELDAREALALCDSLVALGVREVTLSGGEPLRRSIWPELAERLERAGARVEMITNGLTLDAATAARIAEAGLRSVTISVDGPESVHDELRGVPGSFRRALGAAGHLRRENVRVGAATQVNRRNLHLLHELENALVEAGFEGWQLQLTMPHGRCAERNDLVLAPEQVVPLAGFVREARERRRLPLYAADNIGWMTREEPLLRSFADPADRFYPGCQAGLSVVGITSDGTVRGCLSMPPALDEGNLRDRSLAQLWADDRAFGYNRRFREQDLAGGCAECPFRRVCRGGCRSLAWAVTGAFARNPYCLRLRGAPPAE